MKVVQFPAKGIIEVSERPVPAISDDTQVLVHVRYVGICGSDLHIVHGTNPFATYPRVFGHEMAGEVVETGKEVKSLSIGDHVILEPITYCGKCYACTHGQPNVCLNLKVWGVSVDGAASQYLVADERYLNRISSDIPWTIAVLTEPLTIGSQACERGKVGIGDVVVIGGAGTVGLCVLANAKMRGAKCIITDIVDEKLEFALSMGADHAINVKKVLLDKAVEKIAGPLGVNVYIDAVGDTHSVEMAIEMLSPAGRVVCLGFGLEQLHIPFLPLAKKQLEIVGSRLQAGQFPKVIGWLQEGRFFLDDFITRTFPLDQAQEAFKYAIEHAGSYRKLLISMD